MVVSIITNPLTIIRGRAGTGKTQVTVAAAMYATLKYKVKVMIVAASNAACDNVFARVGLFYSCATSLQSERVGVSESVAR